MHTTTSLPHLTRGDLRCAGTGDANGVIFIGEWCFVCNMGMWSPSFECRAVPLFGAWSSSSLTRTSAMRGLCFGSWLKHCTAMVAAVNAAFWGYCPSSLMSIMRNSFLLSFIYGFAQSTKFCSTPTFDLSTARRPDSSSSRTTPKLYTSLLAVNRPVRRQG